MESDAEPLRSYAAPQDTDSAESVLGADFGAVADRWPIGLFRTDLTSGRTDTNRVARQLLGVEAIEAGGAHWVERVHADDRPAVEGALARAMMSGTTFARTLRLVGAGGSEQWVDVRIDHTVCENGLPGLAFGTIVDVTAAKHRELETAAIRRIATRVAADRSSTRSIFDHVAEEVAELLNADAAAVARVAGDHARLIGQHARRKELRAADDMTIPLSGSGATAHAVRTGEPARSTMRGRISVAAPIRLRGEIWGVVGAVVMGESGLLDDAHFRLGSFTEIVETAIAASESRRELTERAERDQLTGLANHRSFHERLGAETERCRAAGIPLGLVLVDLDRFKAVNDTHGHQVGDRALEEAAARLRGIAREQDTVARVGGEEMAWILPDTDAEGALAAAERARASFHARPFAVIESQTASFGIADLSDARDASDLYEKADTALYYAKQTGRDRCVRYSFQVAEDLIQAKAEARGTTSPRLAGLLAVGRAADGRSAHLAGHSERVADIAVRLAATLGWTMEATASLRESAVAHGVLQIGLPGHLVAGAPISPSERPRLRWAFERARESLSELIDDEPLEWALRHLERYDGLGYPDGLAGEEIAEGASIIALSEAWARMTAPSRPGDASPGHAGPLAHIRRESGGRFAPKTVEALERLHEAGALEGV